MIYFHPSSLFFSRYNM